MQSALLKLSLITGWFICSFAILIIAFNLQKIDFASKGFDTLLESDLRRSLAPYNLYSATPVVISNIVVSLSKGDARPLLLDRFFARFRSPLNGFGEKIVKEADKTGVDWRLLAGIAFQESNLCSKIPKGSFNCWGWAIYTGEQSGAQFRSFNEAIEKITVGIKNDYHNRGLNSLTEMMTRYTPLSSGSWAEGVQYAFELIES